jgi:hypothetical protein
MAKYDKTTNRAALAKAEARKAKAYLEVQFGKLDFSDPLDDAVVEIMDEAHRVVRGFLDDCDQMLENEPVVIDEVNILFAPHLIVLGEASDLANVFAVAVHPLAKYFHACSFAALDGETTHQLASRFVAERAEVEVRLMSVILVVKALDGGYGNKHYEDFNKGMLVNNLHALFEVIGIPRKTAS